MFYTPGALNQAVTAHRFVFCKTDSALRNNCRLLSSRTRRRNFMETVPNVKKLREYIAWTHTHIFKYRATQKKHDRLRRQLNSAGRGCSCEEKCSFTNRRDRASLCFAHAIQTRTRSIRAPRGWYHLTCRSVTEPKTASAWCYSTPRAHPFNILYKLISFRWYPLNLSYLPLYVYVYSTCTVRCTCTFDIYCCLFVSCQKSMSRAVISSS